jgi:CheY-like chemotaxis protein
VVDDEFLIALDIQQILESAGARVTVAGGTGQAAEMLRAGEPFDLAVLDIKMSEGVDTTTTLASLLCEGGVPFVFLTGMRADSTEARNFPRAPVIEKPYQADVLLDALRKVLAAG